MGFITHTFNITFRKDKVTKAFKYGLMFLQLTKWTTLDMGL